MDKTISKIYTNINARYKACFYSGLIAGLLAHLYAFTNHLYNYDEIWHTPTGFGTGTQMGRWSLSVMAWFVKRFFGDVYTIPFINGMIALLFHVLAACLVVSVLNVEDKLMAGMVGAVMVTFPAFTCQNYYMFTTHYYGFSLFCCAMGAWIITKKKRNVINIILAEAFLVFGVGIYQSFFATAVCMVVGFLIVKYIEKDYSLIDIVKECGFLLIYLAAGMALYFVSNKIALTITGLKIEEHAENYDTMGQITPGLLVDSLIKCYKTFLKLPFRDVYGINPTIIVKLTFFVAITVFGYMVLYMLFSNRTVYNRVAVCLLVLAVPIATNLVIIMASTSGVMYSIMVYEIVFMLVLAVGGMDAIYRTTLNNRDSLIIVKKLNLKMYSVYSFFLLITVLVYIWFANGNYLALEYTNVHDEAYFTTMMAQIKSVEGYNDDLPLVIIGQIQDEKSNTAGNMIGNTFTLGGKIDSNVKAYSGWNIMTKVIGYNKEVLWSDEDAEHYSNLDEVKSMPCYPENGAIRVVDGAIVIKFE